MCQLTPAETDTVTYITENDKMEVAMSLLDLSSLIEEDVEDVELEDVDVNAAGSPQLTEISGLRSVYCNIKSWKLQIEGSEGMFDKHDEEDESKHSRWF